MAASISPILVRAMQEAQQLVQQRWQQVADSMLTSRGERAAYARGFGESAPVVETAEGLRTSVTNTWGPAARIERGWSAYHLPERIHWGQARGALRSKTGRYYLIIPFRHYSAQRGIRAQAASPSARRQMLPRAIYNVARTLQRGQYLTAGLSHGRAVHAPGLQPYVPAFPPNVRPDYVHAALQERLQRIPAARRGSGQYMTFRTLRQDSPGWWIPGQPARPIVATTVSQVLPDVRRLLAAAVGQAVAVQIQAQIGQGG